MASTSFTPNYRKIQPKFFVISPPCQSSYQKKFILKEYLRLYYKCLGACDSHSLPLCKSYSARQFLGKKNHNNICFCTYCFPPFFIKVQAREPQTCYLPIWHQAHSARICMKGIGTWEQAACRISDQTFFQL